MLKTLGGGRESRKGVATDIQKCNYLTMNSVLHFITYEIFLIFLAFILNFKNTNNFQCFSHLFFLTPLKMCSKLYVFMDKEYLNSLCPDTHIARVYHDFRSSSIL